MHRIHLFTIISLHKVKNSYIWGFSPAFGNSCFISYYTSQLLFLAKQGLVLHSMQKMFSEKWKILLALDQVAF